MFSVTNHDKGAFLGVFSQFFWEPQRELMIQEVERFARHPIMSLHGSGVHKNHEMAKHVSTWVDNTVLILCCEVHFQNVGDNNDASPQRSVLWLPCLVNDG